MFGTIKATVTNIRVTITAATERNTDFWDYLKPRLSIPPAKILIIHISLYGM